MMELAAISVLMVVLSLVGIVWDLASRLLFSGIDGILLLIICLMMGGVFTLELYLVGARAGWVPAIGPFKKAEKGTAPPAKAAAPPRPAAPVGASASTPGAASTAASPAPKAPIDPVGANAAESTINPASADPAE